MDPYNNPFYDESLENKKNLKDNIYSVDDTEGVYDDKLILESIHSE